MTAAEDLLARLPNPSENTSPSDAARASASPTGKVAALTEGQIASARASWTQLGYDPLEFDAAIAGTPPSPEPPADKSPPKPAHPTLSPDQVRQAIERLRAAGVAEERIQAALKADGVDVTDADTPAEVEHDRAWRVEFEPQDYRVDYIPHGGRTLTPGQLAEFNREATTWLSTIGLEPNLGAAVVERAMVVGKTFAKMTEAQRSLWKIEQRQQAERSLGGAEQLDAAITSAARAIKAAGASPFTQALVSAGILNDAWILRTLSTHSARREAWSAARPK
jgi:hypothetical protein